MELVSLITIIIKKITCCFLAVVYLLSNRNFRYAMLNQSNNKQDRQFMYNVTLIRVRATIVVVE